MAPNNQLDLERLQRKTVRTLIFGQALGGFGLGSTLSVGAIMAVELSGSTAWSGAAATLSTLGSAFSAIPLANLAYRKGRRVALGFGAALAILGATGMILATILRSFPVELVALFLLGAGSAVGLQARFAAVDLPLERPKAKDLSLVVWATTVGAVIGPNLIAPGESLGLSLGLPHLAGPFLFTIAAQIGSTMVFWFGLRPDPLIVARDLAGLNPNRKRPGMKAAIEVIREFPVAGYSVLTIALSHMIMVSVMSMTPAHLSATNHSLADVGFTISLHIAGMYAFSPIFGWLTDKTSPRVTIVLGQLIFLTALGFAGLGSETFTTIVIGLFLLGLGWSASTVAGSALLSQSLSTDNKTKVQGFSDTLMNLSGAFGGAVSGTILSLYSFSGLNAAALMPVLLIVFATTFSRRWA
ncbi:MFS transporter [Aquiluna sp. KACHI24]|uniref:MFS transporter n=1 Tax=Aquiluna sp. KACHI24 TaxID=2968831 RepID=UPI00220250AF|nr:MFS transporter [Aquiluna sp. KACHI24]BDP99999.1 MFS transporter [Aquiluna sp. KACHI24]